ncbi:MAG: GNAT family N-acetyltransferase, partial [Actinomycetota bacterium]|nr:GNAT family N-acetyltransferase [Actinomycetota bacterium]
MSLGSPGEPLTDGVVTLLPAGDPGRFLVSYGGAVAGEVRLVDRDGGLGEASWWLELTYRRRGLATRALHLLLRHAFVDRRLHRVEAYVEPEHTASLRLAARAGMRREGVLRGRASGGGPRRDVVVLARLSDDPE